MLGGAAGLIATVSVLLAAAWAARPTRVAPLEPGLAWGAAFALVLNAWAALAGRGLLDRQPWARRAAIAYGTIGLMTVASALFVLLLEAALGVGVALRGLGLLVAIVALFGLGAFFLWALPVLASPEAAAHLGPPGPRAAPRLT